MSFNSHHTPDNPQSPDNHSGTAFDNSPHDMYNPHGFLQRRIWELPEQQFAHQENYEYQYQSYLPWYGYYYCQPPWPFSQQQQQHPGLRTNYNLEDFKDNLSVDLMNVAENASSVDYIFPEGTFSEGFNQTSNAVQLSCQSLQHSTKQDMIGMTTPSYT